MANFQDGSSSKSLSMAGKDALRLMRDFAESVTVHLQNGSHNYLSAQVTSCHLHSWMMRDFDAETLLPRKNVMPRKSLLVVCKKCRTCLSLTTSVKAIGTGLCASESRPKQSHHFHFQSRSVVGGSDYRGYSPDGLQTFLCCECGFIVQAEIMSPIVSDLLLSAVTAQEERLSLQSPKAPPRRHASNVYATLYLYLIHRVDGTERDINITENSPFARRVGVRLTMLNFMEGLGWRNRGQTLEPPHCDELIGSRKTLEAAALELGILSLEASERLPRRVRRYVDRKCFFETALMQSSTYEKVRKP